MIDIANATIEVGPNRISTDGGLSWQARTVPEPAPAPTIERGTFPEDRPAADVRLALPRPLPDPFEGGLSLLREVLGDGLDDALVAELDRARSRVRGTPAEVRSAAERVVALRNAVEGREPDPARDDREVAAIRIRAFLDGGGDLAALTSRAAGQVRQVLLRLSELIEARKSHTYEGDTIGGVKGAGWTVKGLDARIRAGDLGPLEGARQLAALDSEKSTLVPVWSALKTLGDRLAADLAGRCSRLVEEFGRDRLATAYRESLQARKLFKAEDGRLAALRAAIDSAAAEFATLKGPVGAVEGPMEREARERRDAALEAFEARKAEVEGAMLAEVAAVVDRAAAGDYGALLSAARATPRAFPDGFVDAFRSAEQATALEVDPACVAMLLT